ncbi:MAG TPA: RNA polymerase sigma factor [Gemmatimonadales bacterium]
MTDADVADRELAARVMGERDEAAFRALYRRHAPGLYRFALRLSGGLAMEAEEVSHDAWIRAVRALPGFEWRSGFATWLRAIAVNCWRELARAAAKQGTALELVNPAVLDSNLGAIPARVDLERAVAELPPGYREVLVLHDVEGFSHDEIAGLLGIESGTSRSQLFHARRALRRALAGYREATS